MSEDHREIWLEPKCAENDPEGRVWCQHDVWPTCPECGDKSVKYVRADLYDALKDERDELKAAKWAEKHVDTMNDMAALRIAIEGAEAEIERLRAALREFNCPRPANDRPDDFEVGQCVDAGECGCGARFALTGEPVPGGIPLEKTDGLVTAARELLAQLSDFEARIDDIDDEREFIGHVAPAAARLRSCLLDKPGAVEGEPAEQQGPFHVSRSSDGERKWFSARDAASGVTIPLDTKERASALVTSLNRAFAHHLRMAAMAVETSDTDAAQSEIDRLRRELGEARKALEPFANLEASIRAQRAFLQLLICPDGDDHSENWTPKIRAARAALQAGEEGL